MHSHYWFKEVNGRSSQGLNPCFNGRCTRTGGAKFRMPSFDNVLILVLMEDALAHTTQAVVVPSQYVLILVLMEDALAQRKSLL